MREEKSFGTFFSFTCKRRRSIGNSAKDRIENKMSANTDTLVERRDANTTDADTAAFMDSTEESLIIIDSQDFNNIKKGHETYPSLISSSDTFAV